MTALECETSAIAKLFLDLRLRSCALYTRVGGGRLASRLPIRVTLSASSHTLKVYVARQPTRQWCHVELGGGPMVLPLHDL